MREGLDTLSRGGEIVKGIVNLVYFVPFEWYT